MTFGNILKKIRQENNMTQDELAKKIDTSRSNIANYENGKNMPSIDILEKIASLFNCTTDYLLGKTDIRNIEEDFRFAYHKETEGLSEDEIKEALEFYKLVKNRKNNKNREEI